MLGIRIFKCIQNCPLTPQLFLPGTYFLILSQVHTANLKMSTATDKADKKFRFSCDLPFRKHMLGKSPHKTGNLWTQSAVLVQVADTWFLKMPTRPQFLFIYFIFHMSGSKWWMIRISTECRISPFFPDCPKARSAVDWNSRWYTVEQVMKGITFTFKSTIKGTA